MQRCARTRRKRAHLRCLTKIQIRVNKNQENAFFGDFWIDTKKVILFTFSKQAKNYESSKTEYSNSTPFINRLTPLNFFLGSWNFFKGLKGEVPPKNFDFFLLLSYGNRLTWIYSLKQWIFHSKFNEEDARRRFCPPPLNRVKVTFSKLIQFLKMFIDLCKIAITLPQTNASKLFKDYSKNY